MKTSDGELCFHVRAVGAIMGAMHRTMLGSFCEANPSYQPQLQRLLDLVDARLDTTYRSLDHEQASDLRRLRLLYRTVLGLPHLRGADDPSDDS